MGLIYMQFIPLVELGPDGRLADFKGGRPTTSVRIFESLFFLCMGQPAHQCTFRRSCGEYLVVEHNGYLFLCDFFVNNNWKLGNIKKYQSE